MRHQSLSSLLSVGAVAMLLASCDSPARVSEPTRLTASSNAAKDVARPSHPIELLDQCDPTTFNAAIGDGTCLSPHSGIKFDKFIADLIANHTTPAWRN